jgi:hypothetical protein
LAAVAMKIDKMLKKKKMKNTKMIITGYSPWKQKRGDLK